MAGASGSDGRLRMLLALAYGPERERKAKLKQFGS